MNDDRNLISPQYKYVASRCLLKLYIEHEIQIDMNVHLCCIFKSSNI